MKSHLKLVVNNEQPILSQTYVEAFKAKLAKLPHQEVINQFSLWSEERLRVGLTPRMLHRGLAITEYLRDHAYTHKMRELAEGYVTFLRGRVR